MVDSVSVRFKNARVEKMPLNIRTGEIKVSTSTVAARFSKMAFTGQRIAMVDMVLLVFPAFPYLA